MTPEQSRDDAINRLLKTISRGAGYTVTFHSETEEPHRYTIQQEDVDRARETLRYWDACARSL